MGLNGLTLSVRQLLVEASPTVEKASLVPRPRPAFRRLQYGKVGRAWYLFSREHDIISKLRKIAELTGCVSRIFNRLRAQRSVCNTIASR